MSHKTFYAEYTYNGCKPDVKKAIINWTADGDENTGDGAGIRCKPRYGHKKKEIEYVNKEYLESHKNITIQVEMDEI
jgi:hypothetical protein